MKRSGLNSAQTLGMNNTIMFLYGLSAVLIGPTLPGMIDEFSLSLSAGGLVSSMQNAGGFAGAVIALFVADRLSRPGTVIVSFVLLALALIGVGLSRGYLSLVLLFAATGLFIRVLDVMLNAHTGEVGHAAAMSRLHMFFSIGAFVGPIIARAVMDAGTGWDDVYRSVGAVYLIVAVLALPRLRRYLHHRAMDEADAADGAERRHADAETESAPEPEPVAPATPSVDERAGVVSRRSGALTISLLAVMLFFYAIHQIGIVSWLPYFLESARGAASTLASLGLSFYWVGIILGRYLASRAVASVSVWWMLVGGLSASAFASAAAAIVPWPALSIVLFAVAGITSGATIPLAYTGGYRIVPARRGGITAAMSIVMLAGRFLGPWLIGMIGDRSTIIVAMIVPAAALLVGAALAAAARQSARVPHSEVAPRLRG